MREIKYKSNKSEALPHILFVVGQLSIGGIETYVVRMAHAYSKAGGKVSVWVVKQCWDPELLSLLQRVADVTLISKLTHYPAWIHSPTLPPTVELVFTTGRLSLLIAAHACARSARPVRLVAGVFSQWEYCSTETNTKSALASDILKQIGPANIVFCTEGCRSDHQTKLGTDLTASIVSPLLIDLPSPSARKPRKQGDPLNIVSVSRIVSFKTSNKQLPGIIRQLLERGIEAKWTHYGDGPDKPIIDSEIKNAGVQQMVKLAGPIAYSELYKVLGLADLYIGGGTTLIEAASMGTPAIVALDENAEATTPGFFADRDTGYTSDRIEGERLYKIVDLITEFSRYSSDETLSLIQKSILKSAFYNIDRCPEEIAKIIYHSSAREVFLPYLFQTRYILGSFFEFIAKTSKFGYKRNA